MSILSENLIIRINDLKERVDRLGSSLEKANLSSSELPTLYSNLGGISGQIGYNEDLEVVRYTV